MEGLQKVKLSQIFVNTANKDGVPFMDKNGKPFTMVTVFFGDKQKASMYCGEWGAKDVDTAQSWKEGDEVSLMFSTNKNYLNFTIPKEADLLSERVEELERKVKALEDTSLLGGL